MRFSSFHATANQMYEDELEMLQQEYVVQIQFECADKAVGGVQNLIQQEKKIGEQNEMLPHCNRFTDRIRKN